MVVRCSSSLGRFILEEKLWSTSSGEFFCCSKQKHNERTAGGDGGVDYFQLLEKLEVWCFDVNQGGALMCTFVVKRPPPSLMDDVERVHKFLTLYKKCWTT